MKKTISAFAGILAMALSLAFFGSCSGGGNDASNALLLLAAASNSIPNLKYLNIANAKNLYITGGASTSSSAEKDISADAANTSKKKKIFKITENGYKEEVKYLDMYKNEITVGRDPLVIENVNDQYVYVGFDHPWGTNFIYSSYLVRKTDGAVFDITKAGNPYIDTYRRGFSNNKLLKTDKKNNAYFEYNYSQNGESKSKIVKVNLSGIESLEAADASPTTDYVEYFDVDWNGNLIYHGYLASNRENRISRVKKTNGGIWNLANPNAYWIGLDGKIYYHSSNDDERKSAEYTHNPDTGESIWSGEYDYPIKKIAIDENYNVTDEILGYFTVSPSTSYSSINMRFNLSSPLYKVEVKNKILIIDGDSYNPVGVSRIFEVYNQAGAPRIVALNGLTLKSVSAVASTENFYYIAAKDSNSNSSIIKVNPDTDAWTSLLPQNEYDVYAFTASEADGITFNALRMHDGKKIIGKVGINGGAVSVIDEESDAQVLCLERIN